VRSISDAIAALLAALGSIASAWFAMRRERKHCEERLSDFRAGIEEERKRETP